MRILEKPQTQPEAMQILNSEKDIRSDQAPKAIPIFEKPQNTAGGYANFQLKEYDMKAKDARGYAFTRKHLKKPQLLKARTP